jgi:hypothetical protein
MLLSTNQPNPQYLTYSNERDAEHKDPFSSRIIDVLSLSQIRGYIVYYKYVYVRVKSRMEQADVGEYVIWLNTTMKINPIPKSIDVRLEWRVAFLLLDIHSRTSPHGRVSQYAVQQHHQTLSSTCQLHSKY